MLFLIDHDSDHKGRHTAQDAQEEQEEELDAAHARGLGVVHVVSGGLEEAAAGVDLGSVLFELLLWGVEFEDFEGDNVMVVAQFT